MSGTAAALREEVTTSLQGLVGRRRSDLEWNAQLHEGPTTDDAPGLDETETLGLGEIRSGGSDAHDEGARPQQPELSELDSEHVNAEARKDFLVSYYDRTDRPWAEWIGWQLEEAGYTLIVQVWDFAPGSNFVVKMDEAASKCERTMPVLSNGYLTSGFSRAEWGVAFSKDPTGEKGLVVPVRVEPVDAQGLLRTIVYIDLVGLDEDAARTRLLAGVSRERRKPLIAPHFPGSARHTSSERPLFPGSASEEEEGATRAASAWAPVAHQDLFPSLVGSPRHLFHPPGAFATLDPPLELRAPLLIIRAGAAWEVSTRARADSVGSLIADSPARRTLVNALSTSPLANWLFHMAGILAINDLSPWVETAHSTSRVISLAWRGWARQDAPALDAQCVLELPTAGPAGPYFRAMLDVVISPSGEKKSSIEWLPPLPPGFPPFRLPVPNLYGLLLDLLETLGSIRPSDVFPELLEGPPAVVGVHIACDDAPPDQLIDLGQVRRLAGREGPRGPWWPVPTGARLAQLAVREAVVKEWLKGWLTDMGVRDFEERLADLHRA